MAQDVSRAIIASLFSPHRETGAAPTESYVAHVKTYEPDPASRVRKERFLIIAACRDGRLKLHKAKQNSNGTFSIGKTWNAEDLRAVEVAKIRVDESSAPQPLEFTLTFVGQKAYRYETSMPSSQQAAFLVTLVRCWRRYMANVNSGKVDVPASLRASGMPQDLVLVGFSVDASSSSSAKSNGQPASASSSRQPSASYLASSVSSSRDRYPGAPPAAAAAPTSSRSRDGPPPLSQQQRRPSGGQGISRAISPAQATDRSMSPPQQHQPMPSNRPRGSESSNYAAMSSSQRPSNASVQDMPGQARNGDTAPLNVRQRQPSEPSAAAAANSTRQRQPSEGAVTSASSRSPTSPPANIERPALAARRPSGPTHLTPQAATSTPSAPAAVVAPKRTPSPTVRRAPPEEQIDDDTVLSNVEEMLEGFEWRAGAYGSMSDSGVGMGSGSSGRGGRGGKADEIEKQLVGELKALEAASIHAIMESDDRVLNVVKGVDEVLAELEKMDLLLGMFKTSLNMMTDDIAHIEGQNRGLQVQISNQRVLLSEIEKLMDTIQVRDEDLLALTKESLENQSGVENLEKAASNLYKAILSTRDTAVGEMAAASERIDEYRTKAGQFCKRLFDFLAIMFKFQADQIRNPKDGQAKGKALTIPSHGQMEDYLGRYCGLMLFVKEIDMQRYHQICAAYFTCSSDLYRAEVHEMMSSLRLMVRRATEDELEASFSAVKESPNLRQQGIKRAGTLVRGPLDSVKGSSSKDSQTGKISGGEAFDRALVQITGSVVKEQAFVLEFLHVTPVESSITFADYMALETYFRRGATTWLASQKGQLRDVKAAMEQIFGFLEAEIRDWIDTVLRSDTMQIVGILVALDRAIQQCQEEQSEFLQRLLQRQYQKSSSAFERASNEQIKAIEQTKLTLKKRKGVVPFVRVFPLFVARIEGQMEGAEGLRVRQTVNAAYERYVRTIFECLQQMAKMDGGEAQGMTGEDKGLLNYHVILIENMHHVTTVFATQRVPALSSFVSQAKEKYNENLDLYIKLILRRPLSRVLDFFGGLEQLLRTTPPTEVSLHSQYSKGALRRALSEFRPKDARKAVEGLSKRVDKHFGDVQNPSAEHAAVIKTVWKACEEEMARLVGKWRSLIERCYPDEKQAMEVRPEDIRDYFKRM